MKVHYLFNSPRYVFVGLFCILLSQMAQAQVPLYGTITGGNAISVKVPGNFGGNYYTGHSFIFLAVGSVTSGPVTISVNGATPPVGLKKNVSQDLVAGDIADKQAIPVIYDGVNYQVVNAGGASNTSTVAGTGNLHAFLATMPTTAQPLVQGLTNIIYDVVIQNTNNEYNPSTGIFTPNESGFYYISAGITQNNVPQGSVLLYEIVQNGVVQFVSGVTNEGATNNQGVNGSFLLYANAGDQINVQVDANAGSVWPCQGNYFSAFKVNGGGTLTITSFSGSTASGISNLNGLTATSQNFTYSTTGTSVNIASSGSTHNFNIPLVTVVGGNNVTVSGGFPNYTISGLGGGTSTTQWVSTGGGIYYGNNVGIGKVPTTSSFQIYPYFSGSQMSTVLIGDSSDMGLHRYGLGISGNTSSGLWPFGIFYGGTKLFDINTIGDIYGAGQMNLQGPLTIMSLTNTGVTLPLGVNSLGQLVTIAGADSFWQSAGGGINYTSGGVGIGGGPLGPGLSVISGLNSGITNISIGTPTVTAGWASGAITFLAGGIQHGGIYYVPNFSPNGSLNISFGGDLDPAVNSTYFTFTNGGSLGIGITNPAASLDVAGNGRFSGPLTITNLATGGAPQSLWVNATGQLITNPGSSSAITSLNNLTTTSQNFTYSTTGTSVNIVSSGSTHNFNIPLASVVGGNNITVTGSFPLYTVSGLASTATSQWVSTTGGIYYSGGIVGIGNILPNTDFGVRNSNPYPQISVGADNSNYIGFSWDAFNKKGLIQTYANNAPIIVGANWSIFSSTGLGINTLTPGAQLDVNGNTRLAGPVTITSFAGNGIQPLGVNNNGQLVTIPGASLTSISSLNNLTTSSQTFSTSSTGSSINITSFGSVHNFNIPLASIVGGNNITVTGSFPLYTVSGLASTSTSQWVSTTGGSIFYNGGNVGIGNSSPKVKLSVNGSLQLLGGGADLPNTTNFYPVISGGFSSPDIGRLFIGDGTGWKFYFSNRLSSLTSDLITFTDSGQMGIGISNPATNLDVNGNARFTGPVSITGLATGATQALGVNALGQLITITGGTGTSQWVNATGGIYYNGGNVGIGTTTPGFALDLASGNMSIHNNDIVMRDNNHGLGYYGAGPKLWNGMYVDGPVLYGWNGGMLASTSQTPNAALKWYGVGTNDIRVSINDPSTIFGSALATLDVYGNARITGPVTISSFAGAGTQALGVNSFGQLVTITGGTSTSQWVSVTGGIYSPNNIAVNTNPSTTIGINYAISNPNPVTGANWYGLNSSISVGTIYTQNLYGVYSSVQGTDDNAYAVYGLSSALGTNYAGYFKAVNGVNNYGLVVESGNVGIGTITPSTMLDVNGSTRLSGPVTISSFAGGGTQLLGVNNLGQLVTIGGTTGTTQWASDAGGLYYNNGSVSVGSSSNANFAPLSSAKHNGSGTIHTSFGATDGVNSTFIIAHPLATVGILGVLPGQDLIISTIANDNSVYTPITTFKSNGYVGIATTTPSALLDVNGNARFAGPVSITGLAGATIQALGVNNVGQLVTIPGASLTSISSLNNLTTSSQTFSTSSTGSSINISSSGSVHNFNIPLVTVVGGNNVTVSGGFPNYTISGLAGGSTATSQWVSTTAGAIYYSDGNVNIYNNQLTVNSSTTSQILVSNPNSSIPNSSEIGFMSSYLSTDYFMVGVNSFGRHFYIKSYLGLSTTDALNIEPAYGNVGLGTSTPAAKLDVVGNVRLLGPVTITGFAGTGIQTLGINNNGQLVTIPGASSAITSLNNLTTTSQTFSTSSTGSSINITSLGSVHNFNIPLVTVVGGNNVTVSGGFPNYTISGSGMPSTATTQWVSTTGGSIFYNGGNVGIGTANPTVSLEISNPSSALINLDGSAGLYSAVNFTTNGVNPSYGIGRSATDFYIDKAGAGHIFFYNGSNGLTTIGSTPGVYLNGTATIGGGLKVNNLVGPGTVTVDGLGNLGVSTSTSNLANYWTLSGTTLLPTSLTYTLNIGTTAGFSVLNGYSGLINVNSTTTAPGIIAQNSGNNTAAIAAISNGSSSSGIYVIANASQSSAINAIGNNGAQALKATGAVQLSSYTASGTGVLTVDASGNLGVMTIGGNNNSTQGTIVYNNAAGGALGATTSPGIVNLVSGSGQFYGTNPVGYNTGTGLFTASTTGFYHIIAAVPTSFIGQFDLMVIRNGNTSNPDYISSSFNSPTAGGNVTNLLDAKIFMTAGDTFQIYGVQYTGLAQTYMGGSRSRLSITYNNGY